MNVLSAIKTRRSVRNFKSKPVTDAVIKQLIDAARMAPSGNNAQPSCYVVVSSKKTKEKLRRAGVFYQSFVYDAPAIVVCCANPNIYKSIASVKSWDGPNEERAIRDLSIASSYLVLRATELGLGTCYIGWVKRNKIKKVLNIPKSYIVPYVIVVGYAAERPESTEKKKLNEIIHFDEW